MKKKTWSVASVSTLLMVIAIVIVVNLIGLRLFARADLTDNKIYTLSDASKRLVSELEDRLTVKAYFTHDLPPPYNANSRYINDALEDYRSYSNGYFHYEFIDPADEKALEKEAQQYRVQPAQVNVVEKDNLQVKKVYMGLVLIYGDKHETIPIIQNIANFEYEMTSTIKRLIAEKLPKIGFLGNFNTPDLGEEMRNVTTALSRHYEIVPVNTYAGSELIDDEIDVLCIVQPETAFDEWTKFCIDQFVMRGGKVGWFMNKVNADASAGTATGNHLDIDDMTRKYGFSVADNLVTDLNASMIQVQSQQGFFMVRNMVRYPAFPEVRTFNKESQIVKEFQSVAMFFPSSVDTLAPVNGSVTFKPLMFTSDKSKVQRNSYDINPMNKADGTSFIDPPQMLAVSIEGTFGSYFEGKSVPNPMDSSAMAPAIDILTSSPDNRMVVFGEGNFVQDQYMQGGGTNMILFMNAVDWLSQDSDLLTIRSREAAIRPLDSNISDEKRQTVKLANLLGPPILILLFGAFRWSARRNRRKGVTL